MYCLFLQDALASLKRTIKSILNQKKTSVERGHWIEGIQLFYSRHQVFLLLTVKMEQK